MIYIHSGESFQALSKILNDISPVPPATSRNFRGSVFMSLPFSSYVFLSFIGPIYLTNSSFQSLWIPRDIASFIISYESATLENTSATFFYFSSYSTSLNPKSIFSFFSSLVENWYCCYFISPNKSFWFWNMLFL